MSGCECDTQGGTVKNNLEVVLCVFFWFYILMGDFKTKKGGNHVGCWDSQAPHSWQWQCPYMPAYTSLHLSMIWLHWFLQYVPVTPSLLLSQLTHQLTQWMVWNDSADLDMTVGNSSSSSSSWYTPLHQSPCLDLSWYVMLHLWSRLKHHQHSLFLSPRVI
jgi:hypothetical protein